MLNSCSFCSFNMFFPSWFSWLLGRRPEYTDPKVVAQGEGREGLLCICVCIFSIPLFTKILTEKYFLHISIDTHLCSTKPCFKKKQSSPANSLSQTFLR